MSNEVVKSTKIARVGRRISIIIVILISFLISTLVSFFGYFYIFPEIEKRYFTVKVPDVINLSYSEASTKLEVAKLKGNIVSRTESDIVAKEGVISQFPVANSMVKKGSYVDLVISKGMEMVSVPSVKLKPLEEAKNLLISANLRVGDILEEESKSIPAGVVIESVPQEGEKLPKNSVVALKVSKGEPKQIPPVKVIVPNVLGKTVSEATKILGSRGLSIGKITNIVDEDKEFDVILYQFPQAGKSVLKDTKVNITVNSEANE